MRLALVLLGVVGSTVAHAVEVVWLTKPVAADLQRVREAAGAAEDPMTPAAFRAYATAATEDDYDAITDVAAASVQVRVFEGELDGELKILAGLEDPLSRVRLVRDANDREVLIRALLYQGFAVDRFWGDTLGRAPEAVPYRLMVGDSAVERPWLDAFALDPVRAATASDIGEAPQREAYDQLRQTLARVLQATVLAPDLPPGAILVVDGREVPVDDTTLLRLVAGRHWIHVELDGHVVARHAERLDPGQRLEVTLPVPEADWRALLRLLRRGEGSVPDGVRAAVAARGGEVWFADGSGEALRVWSVTPTAALPIELADPQLVGRSEGSPFADVSLAGWAGAGWLHSPDFRDQDPQGVPAGASVVHAATPALGLELAWDRDWLRYGVGVDVFVPLGQHHVARSGEGRYRVRPYPHVVLGHPLVQATFGWVAPYHVAGGAQASVPVVDDRVEIRGGLVIGATPTLVRPDGSSWSGGPFVTAIVGIGGRLRPD